MALLLALLAWMLAAAPAHAQWTHNRGFQLLQRVDDVAFGVDNLSLTVLDSRYVAGTLVRINVHQSNPLRGFTEFMADCRSPLRFAPIPVGARGRAAPEQLEFSTANLLDGTWFAAEFACETTRQPGRAAQIARALFERGGPPDMQIVYCELQPDGSESARAGVEVRFSEAANAVAVNRQWLSSGQVTPTEVLFGSNTKWHIDRQFLHVRRTGFGGEMLFSGACDRKAPPPVQRSRP